jgi:hypothetical protein
MENEPEVTEQPEPEQADQAEAPEPEQPAQESPKVEEREPSEDDLKRAFAALARKKAANKERAAQIRREREELMRERESLSKERQILDRLRSGDEDALRELLGEDYFDRLVQRRLDPQASAAEARLKAELARRDEELVALKRRLDEFDHRQSASRVAQEESAFLQYAKSLDAPELDALEPEEILDMARRLAPQFREEAGRPPTFRELAQVIVGLQKPKIERLKKRLLASPAPAPAKSQKPPSAVTNRDAVTPAGSPPGEDEETAWRRQLAMELAERFGGLRPSLRIHWRHARIPVPRVVVRFSLAGSGRNQSSNPERHRAQEQEPLAGERRRACIFDRYQPPADPQEDLRAAGQGPALLEQALLHDAEEGQELCGRDPGSSDPPQPGARRKRDVRLCAQQPWAVRVPTVRCHTPQGLRHRLD